MQNVLALDSNVLPLDDLEHDNTEYEIQLREPNEIFWRASEHNVGILPDDFEKIAAAYHRAVREWPEASYRIVKTVTYKHSRVLDV